MARSPYLHLEVQADAVRRGMDYLAAAAYAYGAEHGAAGKPRPRSSAEVDPMRADGTGEDFPAHVFERYLAGWAAGRAHLDRGVPAADTPGVG